MLTRIFHFSLPFIQILVIDIVVISLFQIEQVDDDSKQMRGQKVQGKVKHDKSSGGKNIPSVLVKKKKDGKLVASNRSVAPKAQPVKSPKIKSLNGREAQVKKVTDFSFCP